MKKRIVINMFLFDIVPIILDAIIFFILFVLYKVWIAIIIIIPFVEYIVLLIKNIKNYNIVQNKLNNVGKVIYNDGYVVLTNTDIISTKNYLFSVDYKDIKNVYSKKRMFIDCRANSLCIITKDEKKYELIFINPLNPFSSKNHQIKEIIKIIKSHNFDVNIR